MSGQGRTLAILGAVLVVGIGAAVWLALSTNSSDAPSDAVRGDGAASTDAGPTKTAAARPKKQGTAAVFGEIRRSAGKAPVADQEVVLAPERGEAWKAVTDARGAFRFDKLPHGGPYELSAAAKGCATVRIPGIALDRSEQRNVGTLWLDPSVKLTVRVRSQTDLPVQGAVVEAFAIPEVVDWDWSKALAQIGQAPVSVAKTTSDAKGDAVFPEMAVGTWTFVATKAGFAPGGARSVRLRGDEEPSPVTIHLAAGHALDGRVLGPDRKPVAGALVMAAPPDSQWDMGSSPLRARTTSDDEGRYAFAALASGDAQLLVGRTGAAPAPAATVRVPLVAHFDIVLKGVGTLSGSVTEQASGKPVEGASVRASSWQGGGAHAAESVTDADGKYSIEMAAGAINELTVEKTGLVQVADATRPGMQQAAVIHEGENVLKNLQLRHGARLSGVVKDAGGVVEGAHVMAYTSRPNGNVDQKSATTDAQGRYEFPSLDKGSVLVVATKEGRYLPGAPENWWEAVQSPETAKELKVDVPESGEATKDVEMKRGVTVDGVVVGPDDKPLAGARVSGAGAEEGAATGADGAFRLVGVTPGSAVQLACAKEGYVAATASPLVVVADQPLTGVSLRLLREARVRGTVTAVSGGAVAEARVSLAQTDDQPNQPWMERWRWQNAAHAPVKADGTYDAPMPYAPPGKLLVRAEADDRQTADAKPVELVEGQEFYDVDLVLADGADLVGKVVAKAGGARIAGAEISVTPHRGRGDMGGMVVYGDVEDGYGGGRVVWAVTDATGAFRVPHLAPGQFDVRARADGFVAQQKTADVGGRADFVIEMPVELTIEGTVAFSDGRPAEGVQVQAADDGGVRMVGGMGQEDRSAVADSKGFFRLKGIAEGTYALSVDAPWGADVNVRSRRVEGVAAGAKDVRIVVEAGGTIAGRVLDSKRRPIPSAWIYANPSPKEGATQTGNEWRYAQASAEGAFTLVGLGDGPYHVQVSANSGAGGFRPMTKEGVAVGTKELEFLLEDGLSISGVVVDASGKPVVQMAVQATPVDGQNAAGSGSGWTDTSGKFTVSGLAPGEYRIETAQWGGANQNWTLDAQRPVAAGTADLRLVAGKGLTITGIVVDETGKPVDEGWITATGKKGGFRNAQPKADGTFEIGGLEAGQTYTLHSQPPGRVAAQVDDVAAGAKDVRIVSAKGVESSGRLVDAAGKPMPSASISFRHADGKHTQYAQSAADGTFTAGGLVEGTYEALVAVQKADGAGDWKVVGSFKAGDRSVELRMP